MKTDVLVIGGSAAGLVAAITAKSNNPEKKVVLVRKDEHTMIPCGIPYIFGTLDSSDQDVMPDTGLLGVGVEIVIDTITKINTDTKTCETLSDTLYEYDKLVIATGSNPLVPKWLKGAELKNVFTVPKSKVYLDETLSHMQSFKKVAVIGAGFIGVELSDELKKRGFEVTLIEKMPHILGMAFDEDIAVPAQEKLAEQGVIIKTGVGIEAILGDQKVEGILLDNKDTLEVDAVFLAMGYRPNTTLAENAQIPLNEMGYIVVDEFLRTRVKDVFAAGDCAEKRDFATNQLSTIMLASTACSEARVAGLNLYDLTGVRKFKGTIGIYSTWIEDTAYGVAGMTERTAMNEGFGYVTGSFTGVDRHPGKLNMPHAQTVKLVVAKECGRILGGSVVGGVSAGELVNVLGFIIQSGLSISDILVSQIGTHPMLTASPAAYPLIKAAEIALKKLRK